MKNLPAKTAAPLLQNSPWYSRYATLLSVVAYCIVPLILYAPLVFGGKFLWDDFKYAFFPQHNYAAVEMVKGIFPFWNPNSFGGVPFLGDIQTALLYPVNLFYCLFVKNGMLSVWGCQIITILHLSIAGIGGYFLARCFTQHKGIAFFAGLMLMLSGQLTLRIVQPVVVNSMVWVPWFWFFGIRVIDKKNLLYAVGGALAIGMGFLAGYPQFILIGLLGFGAVALFRIATQEAQHKTPKSIAIQCLLCACMIGLGFGLSAAQILPTTEFSSVSTRDNWTYEKACENSLVLQRIATAVVPNIVGKVSADNSEGFWTADGIWSYWEQALFIGTIPIALLVFIFPFARREKWYLFGVLLCALLVWVSLGKFGGIYYAVYSFVPMFNRFRGPSKFLYLYCIMLPLCSVIALTVLNKLRENYKPAEVKKQVFVSLAIGGIIALVCYFVLQSGVSLLGEKEKSSFASNGISGIVWFILLWSAGIGLFAVFIQKKISLSVLIGVCSASLIIEALVHYYTFAPSTVNPAQLHSPQQIPPQLIPQSPENLFRVNGRYFGEGGFPPTILIQRNMGCIVPIQQMEGYTALQISRMLFPKGLLWTRMGRERALGLMNVRYMADVDTVQKRYTLKEIHCTPRAYFVTQYIVAPDDSACVKALEDTSFRPIEKVVLTKPLPWASRSSQGSSQVTVTSYSSNRIDIEAFIADSGILVCAEYMYPAWKAYVDNKPAEILQANFMLRALALTPGKHDIRFVYESDAFTKGVKISLAAFLGCLVLAGVGIGLRKRATKASCK